MQSVDVYWSFRSPYSYLATPGMRELRDSYEVAVNLRVVMPIAIRAPELLFNPQNANRTRYILTDWTRRAEYLGMPHTWPSPSQRFNRPPRVLIPAGPVRPIGKAVKHCLCLSDTCGKH